MEEKVVKEIVITPKHTAQQFSFLHLPISHKIDEIHIISDVTNLPTAKMTVLYWKLYGWQESEDSPKESNLTRYKCLNCRKIIDQKKEYCPSCGKKDFHSYVIRSTKVILEKSSMLKSHQAGVLSEKSNDKILKLIAVKDQEKEYETEMIREGWQTFSQQ